MTNHNFIKLLALIAVIMFISVCAKVYFASVPSKDTIDSQEIVSKTYSEYETTLSDAYATVTSESTTEYHDENGSVKYILNTKTDFHSTIIKDNIVRSYCKCTAEYNSQIVTHTFQNDTTFVNTELTPEFTTDTIDEPAKECSDKCIKYGAAHFFGIK